MCRLAANVPFSGQMAHWRPNGNLPVRFNRGKIFLIIFYWQNRTKINQNLQLLQKSTETCESLEDYY